MTTYRELLARRNEYDFQSVEWKEINNLINSYLRAQIMAGHMEFANMVVSDLLDGFTEGLLFDDKYFKAMYEEYINWFHRWGFEDQARELESCTECLV